MYASGPRLAIVAHRLVHARAGVARYLAELLTRWAEAELPFESVELYVPEPLPHDLLPRHERFRVAVVPMRGHLALWEHLAVPRAARGAEVLFCPSYIVPVAWRGAAVVTIHDALQEVVGSSFPWCTRQYHRRLYRLSARRASCVLTDSESSRRDLERAYGLAAGRIRAVPLGVDERFFTATEADVERVRARYDLTEPFLLFVGKFSRRRNIPTLVRAFARARLTEGFRAHRLVLAGPDRGSEALGGLAAELGMGDAIILPGYVPDEDLPALYRAAEVFVYPSDYEGFGLPPLEAMAAGTAVLVVDTPAVTEVVGDAALVVAEATEQRLADALVRLATDDRLRRELERRGPERARRFTWDDTARETMAVLARAGGLAVHA